MIGVRGGRHNSPHEEPTKPLGRRRTPVSVKGARVNRVYVRKTSLATTKGNGVIRSSPWE